MTIESNSDTQIPILGLYMEETKVHFLLSHVRVLIHKMSFEISIARTKPKGAGLN